jgi:serine protease Do
LHDVHLAEHGGEIMSKSGSRIVAVAALVAVAFAGWSLERMPGDAAPQTISAAQAAPAPVAAGRSVSLPDFSALVEAVAPAVVNISTTQAVKTRSSEGSPSDEAMQEFFRRFGIPTPQERTPSRGVGSGFILSPDGHVLTNAHVVADAAEVTVRLADKREFKAKVVGVDRRTDVALLKIDGSALPAVRIGDASKIKVGEWVAAIGSPFGFEHSVTAGIVSAKSRSLPDETYVPFIQTDVAINPGNSGGPLFNLAGEVIGINSQIYSRTGGYQGLSFAIPIDVAVKVKDQLQKHGKVSRGKLGVTIQPLTRELADSFGLDKPAGALVAAVEKGSPAERAGLAAGDVIVAVNGTRIEESANLPRLIGDMHPGETASVRIWRQGSHRNVPVALGELAPEKHAAAEPETKATGGKLGLSVRPLNAREAQQLGNGGVVVEDADGPAARSGIRPGDVIVGVNHQPVADIQEFRRLVEAAGARLALLIQRGEARLYVPIGTG